MSGVPCGDYVEVCNYGVPYVSKIQNLTAFSNNTAYNKCSTGYNKCSTGYNKRSTGYNKCSTGYNNVALDITNQVYNKKFSTGYSRCSTTIQAKHWI